MKILVVAAHPDDEVLGCGGTIARFAKEDHHRINIAILGEGTTSRFTRRDQADAPLMEVLHTCSHEVGKMLGARGVSLHGLPDNRFDALPLLEVVKIVERLIEINGPDAVYTHHAWDLNVDHRITHQAVLTATRPMRGQCVQEVYAFEIPSSTEWAFQRGESAFQPNVFVDIVDTLPLKVQAFCHYETEIRSFPHPRSPEAITAIGHRWGSIVGCHAAEAFELIRAIK